MAPDEARAELLGLVRVAGATLPGDRAGPGRGSAASSSGSDTAARDGPDLDADRRARRASTPGRGRSRLHASIELSGRAAGFRAGVRLPRRPARPRWRCPRRDASLAHACPRAASPSPVDGPRSTRSTTPGGWHLIGRTDARHVGRRTVTRRPLLRPGDRVRFVPVAAAEGGPRGRSIRACSPPSRTSGRPDAAPLWACLARARVTRWRSPPRTCCWATDPTLPAHRARRAGCRSCVVARGLRAWRATGADLGLRVRARRPMASAGHLDAAACGLGTTVRATRDARTSGCRTYLALAGGVEVPSRPGVGSTSAVGGLRGHRWAAAAAR